VALGYHTSEIVAHSCTSLVFPYSDLEARDFIWQRSLGFCSPFWIFSEWICGKPFWIPVNFLMSCDKEGSGFHRMVGVGRDLCWSCRPTPPAEAGFNWSLYAGLPAVVSDLLWFLLWGVSQHSPLDCHLHATHDFISSAVLFHTPLSEHVNVAVFLYYFLTWETWSVCSVCQSLPTLSK